MNGEQGTGTGTGRLMPAWPTSISFLRNLRGAPFCVKMAVPLPLGWR